MVWHGAGMPRVLETGGEMFQWKISVFEDVGNEGVSYVDEDRLDCEKMDIFY